MRACVHACVHVCSHMHMYMYVLFILMCSKMHDNDFLGQ